MNRREYREHYLKSDYWKEFRANNIKSECFCCGSHWEDSIWNYDDDGNCTEWLELHHINYKNLGKEKKNDVITVCSLCHDYIHEKIFIGGMFIYGKGFKEVKLSNAHLYYKKHCERIYSL
jgi:hypothetical protein